MDTAEPIITHSYASAGYYTVNLTVTDDDGATNSTSQLVNVSWYLNNKLQHTNESTKEANYSLHAEVVGEHNVSAVASNENGTDMQTWVWNILQPTDLPDLVMEDKWEREEKGLYLVYFVVKNIGSATAPRGHYATLYVDGMEKENLLVRMDLNPGRSYSGILLQSKKPRKNSFPVLTSKNPKTQAPNHK
jgi:PKD repeat protein